MSEKALSQKDLEFRKFMVTDNMWRVIFKVCTPLALYQGLSHIFRILDSIMASHISSTAISAVTYITQINIFISSIGGGLAIGAGIKISEAYGANDFTLVKKRVSSLYALSAIFCVAFLLIIPFSDGFLRINGMTDSLISVGKTYFIVELIAIAVSTLNYVYIAVERSRGASKRILYLNVMAMLLKSILGAIFIYGFNGNIVTMGIATLVSQTALLIVAIININRTKDIFGFSVKSVSVEKEVTLPVLKTSYPVVAEKAAFTYGKLIVNAMSTGYGDDTVGALGISNNIGGVSTAIQNGVQEGATTIISVNKGAGEISRSLDAFKKVVIINVIIGAVFLILTLAFIDPISVLFSENNFEFRRLIKDVYSYEALGTVTLGINAAVMALMYGFGYTKITLLLNFLRIFLFRVPVLWYLQNFTDIGSKSVGIVMMVSNISVGIVSIIAGFLVIKSLNKKYSL